MKKFFLTLIIGVFAISFSFSANTILAERPPTDVGLSLLNMDNHSQTQQLAVLRDNLEKVSLVIEMQKSEEGEEDSEEIRPCCWNCSIITINCHCGVSFSAQYCKGKCCPHPADVGSYAMDLCVQACMSQV